MLQDVDPVAEMAGVSIFSTLVSKETYTSVKRDLH